MPYYFYCRSDKKEEGRISVTAKLIAKLLEAAGANRILTMDLHAPQIQVFPDIPCDQLSARSLFYSWISKKRWNNNIIIVAADDGRVKDLKKIHCKHTGAPLAIINKIRTDDTEVSEIISVSGQFSEKKVLLFDDEGLTLNTLWEDIKYIQGADEIYGFMTHFIASDSALDNINEIPITKLIVTDTIPLPLGFNHEKIEVLSVAPIFAEAIRRINNDESISTYLTTLDEPAT